MGELGMFLTVVAVMLLSIHQIRADPRIDRVFLRRSFAWALAYLSFAGLGILSMFVLIEYGRAPGALLAVFVFYLTWIAIGVVWLIRVAPKLRTPPAWVMRRWGVLDLTLIAICAGAALYALVG